MMHAGVVLDDDDSSDPVADTARMNRWIEQEVRRLPEQYLWVHRRFKTRPAGAAELYPGKDKRLKK
mgnify:CR=1 FL=1